MIFPKISVITPSFNQGTYLEETIQSVLNQKYPNLEYIIIDGGSTDNSVEIIKKYQDHLTYWISEKDSGQSEAINKGFEIATGEIITWINSDDLLLADVLLKIASLFMECDENIGVIHGGTIIFDNTHSIKEDHGYNNPTIERYISGMSFAQPSAFIRKKYYDMIAPMNILLDYGMDYDIFCKLSLVSEFKKIRDCLSKYRIHEMSKSSSQNHLFINDWINTFINVLNNFSQSYYIDILDTLQITKSNKFEKLTFKPIHSNINWDLAFYYFLTYVFRSDYMHSNFKRAKLLRNYLKSHYNNLMHNDSDLKLISSRLRYFPESMIRSYRKLNK